MYATIRKVNNWSSAVQRCELIDGGRWVIIVVISACSSTSK